MPQPTSQEVHVNQLLTDFSVAFIQSTDKFAALKMFPGVNVKHKSNLYAVYSREDFLRDEMVERAPSTESAGGGYSIDLTNSYLARRYAFHVDIDDDTRDNYDDPLAPDEDAAAFLAQKALIKTEVLWAAAFFTTSVWTGGTKASGSAGDLVAGTDFTAWDDVASTPLEDVAAQQASVESQTGFLPNKLCLNRKGWNALKNHPDIVDRIKHTSAEPVQRAIVARLMELDEIVVGAAVRNSAAKGVTGSFGYVFGNHALLAYVPSTPRLRTPSAGYTFRWNGMTGAADGTAVTSVRAPLIKSDRHEIEMNIDMRVVSSVCGAFFQNVSS